MRRPRAGVRRGTAGRQWRRAGRQPGAPDRRMRNSKLRRIGAIGALAVALLRTQSALTGGLPGAPEANPAAPRAQAAPVVPVPTAALEAEAEQIFSGTVTGVQPRPIGGGLVVNTDIAIRVT